MDIVSKSTHSSKGSTSRRAGLNVGLTPLRFLQRSAAIHPNKTACVDGTRRISFAQMKADAESFAAHLLRQGIQPGQRIGVLAPNSYEALLAQFAIPLAGGVVVALNTRLAPAEIDYIVEHSEITHMIADRELAGDIQQRNPRLTELYFIADYQGRGSTMPIPSASKEVQEVPDDGTAMRIDEMAYQVADEDAAIAINYTSGTTGKPKGVVYTHRGAYLNALGQAQTQRFDFSTVYLWTLPMFHCSGWCTGWAAMAVSATQVCIRAVRGPEMWRLIANEGVTAMCGAPAVLTTLVDDENKRRVQNLRIVTAGAPPSPTIITRCENLGVEVIHVYGLTETYGPYTVCEPQVEWDEMTVRRRAVLKARQGVATVTNEDVRVVYQDDGDAGGSNGDSAGDGALRDVPADGTTMGEVVLTGNGVMREYYRDPEVTEEAFRGGYFHTGDLGVMHPDGYIQLLDRAKDVIISGGENISTIEVEQAVISYPDVSDVAVIGVPDEKWGERPRAYVVLRPEALGDAKPASAEQSSADDHQFDHIAEAIIAHCRAHIAGFKVPREIRVVSELPRTSTGKVQKNVLREQA